MNYFTMEWWCSIQGKNNRQTTHEYNNYYISIKDKVPSELSSVHLNMSLHDCHVIDIINENIDKKLTIQLEGDDGKGNLRIYQLEYGNVDTFTIIQNNNFDLPSHKGFGDWGYEEIYIHDNNRYEEKIIFSSGIEIQIIFETFKVSW